MHRRVVDAEGLEDLPPADTEHHLLPEPALEFLQVEAVGDAPVLGEVLIDMGIEEVERDAPHLHLPDRDIDGGLDQGDLHHKVPAVLVEHPEDRCGVAVEDLSDVLLPPVPLDVLVKVALGVHEPDGDRRDAEVARRLDVVAGKDAEPPRVEGKRVMEPELA
ncbi:hypothetical protein DSECCO2_553960 [anaerobic digester metagenome]